MDSGFGLKRQHEFPKRQNSGSYLVLFSESFGFVQPLYMAEYQMRFQVEAQHTDLVSVHVHAITLVSTLWLTL